MSIHIHPIDENSDGPIHLVIAGYRARPSADLIRAAQLPGSTYAVQWAAGKWAEAGASAGVLARAMQVGVPAMKTGRILAGVGSLAGGAGGAIALGIAQFRHRYYRAQRDGQRLADALHSVDGIRDRPLHLYGHSLGTVVMRSALQSLHDQGFQLRDVMLMGGVASRFGWDELANFFSGRLVNLYSAQDRVLTIAPVIDRLVGTGPINESSAGGTCSVSPNFAERVFNHNMVERLPRPLNALAHHSGYWKWFGQYVEAMPASWPVAPRTSV